MQGITRLKIEGFKSIRTMEEPLELHDLNVLIGANGSGKSNLVSFFRLLRAIGEGRLQATVAEWGGGNSLLHYGPKVTAGVRWELHWGEDDDEPCPWCKAALQWAEPDGLVFAAERWQLLRERETRFDGTWGPGHRESAIAERRGGEPEPPGRWATKVGDFGDGAPPPLIAKVLRAATAVRCYHFNDTTSRSSIRLTGQVAECSELLSGAENLAAYLLMLHEDFTPYYGRIADTIRLVAPFLGDFVLEPSGANREYVMLRWRDTLRGQTFGPHQLSDGTLRFMALATLLLQPEECLPKVIVIDEPELGLHPYALSVLAGMLRSASHFTQIIVATQSAALVEEFEPEDIVVTEHHEGESTFRRLNSADLSMWLEDYSVGDLWRMNVVGGGPSR